MQDTKICNKSEGEEVCIEPSQLAEIYRKTKKEPVPKYQRKKCLCAEFKDGKYCQAFHVCVTLKEKEVVWK